MPNPSVTLVGPLTWRGSSRRVDLQLGLLSLAAAMRPRGITPQIIDLNLLAPGVTGDDDVLPEAVAAILDTGCDLVGFGSICSSYPLTMRLAAEVKRARPSLTVVLGGPQASVVDRPSLLAFPAVDFVVRGEAERSFPELLDALAAGSPLGRIAGVSYRRDRQVLRNPNAPVIHDLDELPLPLYDYYPDIHGRASLPLEAGRGCPFACRFCSTNDFFRRNFRLKSAAKLVAEMAELATRYGVLDFQLTHDMFTVDRKRVAAFCEALLGHPVAFTWRCSARTDCVDADLLALMAKAGCRGIFFGIETGSQRMQHIVRKDLDLQAARETLAACDALGIHTTASLITGYPEEELEDLDSTLRFFGDTMRLQNCDPQLHLLAPLAETPLATEYRERLVYDRIASDVSGDRDYLDPVDELLALAHPDIFPNFYALPCPLERAYLQHLRAFLLAGSARAKGLLLALHAECGGLRAFYDAWRATCPAPPPVETYKTWEFFEQLLAFIEARYFGCGLIGVEVMARFYGALEADARRPKVASAEPLETEHFRLPARFRLVTVRGDVIAVLGALRNFQAPAPEWGERVCTLAVETCEQENSRILELPPLAAAILSACRQTIGLPDLERRLARSGIGVRLPAAILILERQGLLEVIPAIEAVPV